MLAFTPSLSAMGIYSRANMPNANSTEPMAMLPMAHRLRLQSLGPHRMARDISASSEKNLFSMGEKQNAGKKRGQETGAKILCPQPLTDSILIRPNMR